MQPVPIEVLLLPVDDQHRPWHVTCTCGFTKDAASYGPAYAFADRHLVEHLGPDPRAEQPGGPNAMGAMLAISPEAGDDVLEVARELWLAFDAHCDGVGWGDRKTDPEAWLLWLNAHQTRDPGREASVLAYRSAWRASMAAAQLRYLTADAGWQERIFEVATALLQADDDALLHDVVVASDGLTLDTLWGLVGGPVDALPAPLRKRLEQ
jgi:hypothetical protein